MSTSRSTRSGSSGHPFAARLAALLAAALCLQAGCSRGLSERPKYVSEATGADGRYVLFFPEGGTFYLAARNRFGGPPKIGELYGRYDDGTVEPSAIHVKDNQILEHVDITVHKVW